MVKFLIGLSHRKGGSMYLLTLLVVPVALGLIAKVFFRKQLTWAEFGLMHAVVLVILAIGYGIAKTADLHDFEYWNGQITGKEKQEVRCRHSYDCRCVPVPSFDSDGNVSIDVECDTCYRHDKDFDWVLTTNIGESIVIRRVDDQGVQMPPAWERAQTGEGVAIKKSYFNYARRNPGLVIRVVESVDMSKYMLPAYPDQIHDFFRVNRFLDVGYSEATAADWNHELQQLNGRLNPQKEVNILVVAAKADKQFEYALEQHWLGGKKNDVVVVLGVPEYPKITWAGVITWSLSEDFRNGLSQELIGVGDMAKRNELLAAVESHVRAKFVRRTMAEIRQNFATLEPTKSATIVLYSIGLVLEIGLLVICLMNSVTERRY